MVKFIIIIDCKNDSESQLRTLMFSNYYIPAPPKKIGIKALKNTTQKIKTSKAFNYRFSSNYFNILSLTYQ